MATPAKALDRPLLSADQPTPMLTQSRVSATIEFPLPDLAKAIEKDIPLRLTTINEHISCVHRRVLGIEVNASCDITGYVERTAGVALRGEGDRLLGELPLFGTVSGRGSGDIANNVHASAQGRLIVQAEARPQLRHDWSLDLHFSDGFHWSQPPLLQVFGHDFDLRRFVEPKIKTQLDHVRSKAAAFAQKLDLHNKAATAWRHAFEPVKLADSPEIWLQMKPQTASFAGVHANAQALTGAIEIAGTAETIVGQPPPQVTAQPLPSLGTDVSNPGTFDVIVPVRINYDILRQRTQEAMAALGHPGDTVLKSIEVYPSSGKIVIALQFAKASNADPKAADWVYLSGTPQIDDTQQILRFADLTLLLPDGPTTDAVKWLQSNKLPEKLKQTTSISYKAAYDALLAAANAKLTRPLTDGFRMEGHLAAARLDKISLLPDGVSLQLLANGTLKIIYGL